jgi:hypothetical protein
VVLLQNDRGVVGRSHAGASNEGNQARHSIQRLKYDDRDSTMRTCL